MQTVGWWVGYHILPALPYNRHYNALKTYHKMFRICRNKWGWCDIYKQNWFRVRDRSDIWKDRSDIFSLKLYFSKTLKNHGQKCHFKNRSDFWCTEVTFSFFKKQKCHFQVFFDPEVSLSQKTRKSLKGIFRQSE